MAIKMLFNEWVSSSICSAPTSEMGLHLVDIVFKNLDRNDSTNLSQKDLKNLGEVSCFLILGITEDRLCAIAVMCSD